MSRAGLWGGSGSKAHPAKGKRFIPAAIIRPARLPSGIGLSIAPVRSARLPFL
jgi:hypothetical protein